MCSLFWHLEKWCSLRFFPWQVSIKVQNQQIITAAPLCCLKTLLRQQKPVKFPNQLTDCDVFMINTCLSSATTTHGVPVMSLWCQHHLFKGGRTTVWLCVEVWPYEHGSVYNPLLGASEWETDGSCMAYNDTLLNCKVKIYTWGDGISRGAVNQRCLDRKYSMMSALQVKQKRKSESV